MASLDITPQIVAFRVLALLLVTAVQGGIVAAMAYLLGDKGPEYDGRLTLVPSSHLDLVGGFSFVVFGLGWGKPVAVDAGHFRTGRVGIVAVILAGFAGLLVLAALLAALVLPALEALPHSAALTTAAFLRSASNLSISFALFNLMPIPPLTGALIAQAAGLQVPMRVQWAGAAVLLIVIVTGAASRFFSPAHSALAAVILGR